MALPSHDHYARPVESVRHPPIPETKSSEGPAASEFLRGCQFTPRCLGYIDSLTAKETEFAVKRSIIKLLLLGLAWELKPTQNLIACIGGEFI